MLSFKQWLENEYPDFEDDFETSYLERFIPLFKQLGINVVGLHHKDFIQKLGNVAVNFGDKNRPVYYYYYDVSHKILYYDYDSNDDSINAEELYDAIKQGKDVSNVDDFVGRKPFGI